MGGQYTTDQILEEHRRALAEDRAPFSGPSAVESAPGDIFSGADLDEPGAPPVEYIIPGRGKRVWIHATTPADYLQVMEWGVRPSRIDDAQEPSKLVMAKLLEQQQLQMEMKVLQVICCCRVGPAADAERCFKRQDRDRITKRLGYQIVQEICRISDELSGGDEALGQSAKRFFGLVSRTLRICSSRCGSCTGSPDGWSATLVECESLARRLQSRGSVDSILSAEIADYERSLG